MTAWPRRGLRLAPAVTGATVSSATTAPLRTGDPDVHSSRERAVRVSGGLPRGHAIRPEIQALRAVAVGTVVVYHLWPNSITGGFIGVDVFFAISGFLITSLLLREIDKTGRLSLTHFWARRARRILPAALITTAITAAATAIFVPLTSWQQWFAEMRASTEYIQNWHLAHAAVDYFASENAPSPVQHYWSLSVEEQFYIVWPVLMILGIVLMRRRGSTAQKWAIGLGMAVLTVVSLIYGIAHTDANPAEAYFITPTRAWEFGLGGLLALTPPPGRSHSLVRSIISWLGFAAIGVAAATFSTQTPFPGVAAFLPILGTVAVIGAGLPRSAWSPTPIIRLAPVQFLGDISYSVYLWHWPLLILAPFVLDRAVDTPVTIAILMLTILIAWISKLFIEDPVRKSHFLTVRRTGWTFGFAAMATGIVLGATALGTDHVQAKLNQDAQATKRTLAHKPTCFGAASHDPAKPCTNGKLKYQVVPSPVEAAKMKNSPCPLVNQIGRVRPCSFGSSTKKPTRTIALVGDSHASHWRAAVDIVAKQERWRGLSITHTSCPFSAATPQIPEPGRTECREWKEQTIKWFKRHPEVTTVFVSQHTGGMLELPPGADQFKAQVKGYADIWKALPKSVEHVIVIRDTPKTRGTTLSCVQQAMDAHQQAGPKCKVPRGFALERDPSAVAAAQLKSSRYQAVDLTRYICDRASCYPVIGGALVFKDIHHLTTVFAQTLAPYMKAQVDGLKRAWK